MANFAVLRPDGSIATIVVNSDESELSSVVRLPDEGLPDRYFREAWAHRDGKVVIDMPRAREIWQRKMRTAYNARAPFLDDKQRDELDAAINTIDLRAADNVDELRALWPTEHLGPG